MARLPKPGGDDGTWGSVLNSFLGVEHTSTGALKIRSDGTFPADTHVVHNTGDETVGGVKTFTGSPLVPTPTASAAAANKTYVDNAIAGATGASPATSTTFGMIKIAGDLAGSADAPTVPGKASVNRTITAGTGLNGGGDLTANRTLSVSFGTTAGTAAQGDDSRITGALQKSVATTKGDLLVATAATTIARLGVGSDDQVLTADSSQPSGVRWAAVPSAPVSSVAGKTGAVTLDEGDVANLSTDLAAKADKTTSISAGTGLSGGGDLSANRSLSVSYGSTAGTATEGNDSRVTGALQKSTATTKGDLLVASAAATIARLGVGGDNQVLTADSTQPTGMKWANAPSAPVTSVANKTGAVTLVEGDITNLTTDLGAKADKTTTLTAGTGLTGGGDLSANRTFSVASDTTTQKVEVASGGTLQGTRKRINFVVDGSVTITVSDDSTNNKVDVTVSDHIYVQSAQPSSPTTNDIWLW